MSTRNTPSLLELFLETPTQTALLTLGPLVLAVGQLVNGYTNDISPLVTLGFAGAMVVFSVVATGHHAAERRLQRLETDLTVSDGHGSDSARHAATTEVDD